MKKEELIQELEKIEGINPDAFGYFFIRKDNVRVEYREHNNELTLIKYEMDWSGEYDSHEIYFNNLEPATILEIFQRFE